MYAMWAQYSLLNDAAKWRSCSRVTRGNVPRSRIWLPLHDERPCVLIGAGGMWRSNWQERVLFAGVRAKSDR